MRRTGGIQRSTSFKMNSLQYSNAFGCTYYGAHSFCNAKDPDKDIARPITRKKRSVIMDKTTVNWNCPNNNSYYEAFSIYGKGEQEKKVYDKNRMHINNQFMGQKSYFKNIKGLPRILLRNAAKFDPNIIEEDRDEYIQYIINKKRGKSNENFKFNKNHHGYKMLTGSGRKDKTPSVKQVRINGIDFEINSKCDISPKCSLDYLKSNITKEMNLICYDFNGAKKRMVSDSPQFRNTQYCIPTTRKEPSKPTRLICHNKTTAKFFQSKDKSKMRFTLMEKNVSQEKSKENFINQNIPEEESVSSGDYEVDSEECEESNHEIENS